MKTKMLKRLRNHARRNIQIHQEENKFIIRRYDDNGICREEHKITDINEAVIILREMRIKFVLKINAVYIANRNFNRYKNRGLFDF